MVSCMKTTIEISDEVLIEAKKKAAELRCSLRSLVEQALRRHLRGLRARPASKRGLKWVTVDGGLAPGLDVSDRAAMHEWLRDHR